MKRLIEGLGLNSSSEYDNIFAIRALKGVDEHDLKRWKKLIKFYKGGRFIDLGCLDSLCPILIKEQWPREEVWGIDIASEAIAEMQRRNAVLGIYYQVGDVYNTGFPKNYFSYAVAGEILEHLDDPEKFIAETFRILKSGGTLALSTPLGEENEPGAVDGERHVWSWETEDMYRLMGKYGKVTTKMTGSEFYPKYVYHWPTLYAYVLKD